MNRSGSDRFDLLREDFDRLLDQLTAGAVRPAHEGEQAIPINVFETDTELVVVAAMPGIESRNVQLELEDSRLTVRGEKRGPGQERLRYMAREWTYGPYGRTIELPRGIDLDRVNATYGNGVVTIAFPKAASRRRRRIAIATDADRPKTTAA
jgi:HSP20 family protein